MPNTSSLPESIMSHVSVGTNDYPRAKAFYTAVLGTLEVKVMMEHPGAVAFGRAFPEFWVGVPHDGAGRRWAMVRTLVFSRSPRRRSMLFMPRRWNWAAKVMARRARVSCMGRSITVLLCATWMGTRSRPCSGMRRPEAEPPASPSPRLVVRGHRASSDRGGLWGFPEWMDQPPFTRRRASWP